ncbi:heat-inducible transcriptional repressor HrcA [Roseburia sp. 831b]|uniref:heat-inducible transcriptional repressor HrcA n=1 Tax=Roseburia sp. 831b TaxID=1261635 RepID=UPI000950FE17|nr:heat-inducible transcriptional repressor HrcA [Roseburia sp. 831b]WVK73634.1 heat-inducible transcriptional repressor HrcA [Roseburia sp. 831b]
MEEFELDDRKTKILNAIIKNYMETGEPVGSRTISKYTDLNLSSATIRNEMADLEELGYIVQPHTSAGRIPSDKGYRFYVDNLMAEKNQEVSDMKDFVIEHTEKMEQVLQKVAKILATNTNYATMVSAPSYHKNKVKFIQLSNVQDDQILAVIVTEGNIVKNKMISVSEPIDNETMLKLNILLNSNLNGLALQDINLATIAKLKEQAGIHSDIISNVLDTIAETMGADDDIRIYTSGATNFFKYPELSDSEKASELISTFEEKQQLASLVTENLLDEENTGIQVYIGNESPIQTMKDCSVVTATYELGEGVRGTIGIVGPKRMDYEKVMDNLKTLKNSLDGILDKQKNELE